MEKKVQNYGFFLQSYKNSPRKSLTILGTLEALAQIVYIFKCGKKF
jgi:hypothetical protein